jgi:hypothetical protein
MTRPVSPTEHQTLIGVAVRGFCRCASADERTHESAAA